MRRQLETLQSDVAHITDPDRQDDFFVGGGVVTKVTVAKNDKRLTEKVADDVKTMEGLTAHQQKLVEKKQTELEKKNDWNQMMKDLKEGTFEERVAQALYLQEHVKKLNDEYSKMEEENEKLMKRLEAVTKQRKDLDEAAIGKQEAFNQVESSKNYDELMAAVANATTSLKLNEKQVQDAADVLQAQFKGAKNAHVETRKMIAESWSHCQYALHSMNDEPLRQEFYQRFGKTADECVNSILCTKEVHNDKGERLAFGLNGIDEMLHFGGRVNGALKQRKTVFKQAQENLEEAFRLSEEVSAMTGEAKTHVLQIAGRIGLKPEDLNYDAPLTEVVQDLGKRVVDVHGAVAWTVGALNELMQRDALFALTDIKDRVWELFGEINDAYEKRGQVVKELNGHIRNMVQIFSEGVASFTGRDENGRPINGQRALEGARQAMITYDPVLDPDRVSDDEQPENAE